jgi:hypothetical protein
MFVLDCKNFNDNNIANTRQFIDFWSQFISDPPITYGQKPISYIDELNIGNDLTQENVKRLLCWKDSRFWIGRKKQNVLRHIQELNNFRRFGTDKTKEIIDQIFPHGLIYTVFLFHIARPWEFPIADQNVFRSYTKISGNQIPSDWKGYNAYRKFFLKLCKATHINNKSVKEMKRLDNALFVFGQFLKKYGI